MKKDYLQIFIIVLVTFLIGLFIGTQISDKKRYEMIDSDLGIGTFDTKTGIHYVLSKGEYFKGDVKNANIENYKSKKSEK